MSRLRLRTLLLPLLIPGLLSGCASAPSRVEEARVIAFGDSYTEGFGARPDDSYPAELSRLLGVGVANRGVTGETAGEALRRLERDVLRHDPDLVIVEFGVNEAYRGYPVERSLRDLETMVERIGNGTDARIVLVGVRFWSFQEEFDEGLRGIAERHGTGLVLDVLDGIVPSRKGQDDGDPALRHDEYHPNAAGYALMAQRIRPAAEAELARSSP